MGLGRFWRVAAAHRARLYSDADRAIADARSSLDDAAQAIAAATPGSMLAAELHTRCDCGADTGSITLYLTDDGPVRRCPCCEETVS